MQRGFRFVSTLAVLSAVSVQCLADWPTYQHDLQNTGRSDASWDPRELRHSWTAPAGFNSPIVQGDRVYAYRIFNAPEWPRVEYAAFDLNSGRQLWAQQVKWLANAPAVADGMLVSFDYDRHLRAFDAETGALLHDTVYNGRSSVLSSPALVDVPAAGAIEAYFPTFDRFTKFNVTRTGSSLAWDMADQSTGGTPTVVGESVIATGPGAYFAYRQSDGQRSVFYSGPITGGAVRTGLYDQQRHRFYAEEYYGTGDAISAWDYTDNGHITLRWTVFGGPRGFASAALDADGDLWFVDQEGLLREYSPEGQLLRSSTRQFQQLNTPVIQDGYLWINDETQTHALDLDTLEGVRSLPGKNGWGNGFRSAGVIFDNGFILDRGDANTGFDVYVVPEPCSATLLFIGAACAILRRPPCPKVSRVQRLIAAAERYVLSSSVNCSVKTKLCSGKRKPARFWSMWLNISSISATRSLPTVTRPVMDAPCSESCSIFAL